MRERVQVDGKEIVLVGTAHVSEESADEVNSAIGEEDPDTVAVELDQQRYDALKDQKGWEDMDVAEALEDGKGSLLMMNVLLSIYQRRLGENLNVRPGSDMLAAVHAAEERGKAVELVDRDISDTLRSAGEQLSLWDKARLSTELLASLFQSAEVTAADVEKMKEGDALQNAINELGDVYPGIKRAFLDERNAYMAQKLRGLDGEKIAAVVGAAHVAGIAEELRTPSTADKMVTESRLNIPVKKLLEYGIPTLIVGMLAYIFVFVGFEAGSRAFAVWFLLNGILAAVGAVAARAHPFTTGISFVAAPFTSINPLLPSGLVAAYAENRFNPPKVKDLEAIGEVSEMHELWTNSALKLLLIFMLVNLGSSIASYLGAGYLAQIIV